MPETMPIPVRFQDGEVLSAAALNQLQEVLLRQLLAHTHSGSDGPLLGPEGIAPGAIQSQHLGPVGLGPGQIAAGAVGATQLAEHVVAGHHLAARAVLTEALDDGAVTLLKLANDVLAEIKKPRGATTYGWCAYLDPALLYPAAAGQPWYDWLLDPDLPLPAPKVRLLEGERSLPFLLDAKLDASPPVKPKGPPVEPKFTGVDPGQKPVQPTFTATPPTAPNFARPQEPARPGDLPLAPPGAPPKPDAPELGEPGPNGETQEIINLLRLQLADLNRQLDSSVSDQELAEGFKRALSGRLSPGLSGIGAALARPFVDGLLRYRQERRIYLDSKAKWNAFREQYKAYEVNLVEYRRAYDEAKGRIQAQYDQALRIFGEQKDAWRNYDAAFAAFQGGQAEFQRAMDRYQVELRAWDERAGRFHQAEGEYKAKREEYDRLKAEYDQAMARYQAEKENFVARIQPAAGFPAGELTTERFRLQVDPAAINWPVSPIGPQVLRPAVVTNEPFTVDGTPVSIAPGKKLNAEGRSLLARIAYAFSLPEDLDPVQRPSARLYQFLNTPGFLLGGYQGEMRNVRSIVRMHEGESRFVRIRFDRPYPAATYTVSVTPDGRPGTPVPQPFVWRQAPTYVDLCFQVGSALVDALAFRFAIHGELSES